MIGALANGPADDGSTIIALTTSKIKSGATMDVVDAVSAGWDGSLVLLDRPLASSWLGLIISTTGTTAIIKIVGINIHNVRRKNSGTYPSTRCSSHCCHSSLLYLQMLTRVPFSSLPLSRSMTC